MQTKPEFNKILLFILSIFPGAGHMYLGYMKSGVSFMILFLSTIALGTELYMNLFFFLLPIIWFYSFFDVWQKSRMSFEEYSRYEDKYLFMGNNNEAAKNMVEKYKNGLGVFAIILGICLIFRRIILPMLYSAVPNSTAQHLREFAENFPQLAIALVIIILGFWLIGGKRREIEETKAERSKESMAAAFAAYRAPEPPVQPVKNLPEAANSPVCAVSPVSEPENKPESEAQVVCEVESDVVAPERKGEDDA